MNFSRYIFFVLFCLGTSLFSVLSQEEINIGQKYAFQSQVLNESRELFVYLPDSYHQENNLKKYPVMYLLDGESRFVQAIACLQSLSQGRIKHAPEMIVVAVVSTKDRSKDLTPPWKTALQDDGTAINNDSGRADLFFDFLSSELRGYVDEHFRTSGYNLLAGHSFGGLFAMYVLLHHTVSFDAYVAIDPSLWRNEEAIFQQARQVWKEPLSSKQDVFIAYAHSRHKEGGRSKHAQVMNAFCKEMMKSNVDSKRRADWKSYPGEDHGTVFLPGLFDGLRFVFAPEMEKEKIIQDNK